MIKLKDILTEQLELPRGSKPGEFRGGQFNPLKHLQDPTDEPIIKPKVLFVGDSQTANSWSYANQLIKSGLIHKDSQNKALGGSKTSKIMGQLSTALNSGIKFDIINIMGGGNNAWNSADFEAATLDLQFMYNTAKKHRAIVVAISNPNKNYIVPTEKRNLSGKEIGIVKKRNNEIAQFVKNRPPKTDIIINANNYKKVDYIKETSVGVHLNSTANIELKGRWIETVLPYWKKYQDRII